MRFILTLSLKDETCPIGSSRRLGHVAQFSSSSDSHAYVDRAVHPGRPALAFPDASRTLSSSRRSRVAQAIFQTLQAEQRRPPHESWRAAILLPRCSSPQVHRSSSVWPPPERARGGCGGRIVSCRLRGGRTPIHSQLLQRLLPRSNPASSAVASHGHTTPSPAGIYSQLRSFVRPCASCRGSAGRPPRNNLRSVRYIFFVGKCTTTRLQLTSIRSCDYAAGLMRHCLLLFVVD